ncbi:MAG TPA: zinc-ribbon domain-containing protein [bacterium]|nr:zinc-ribbon domain-containing protein [bacterium]
MVIECPKCKKQYNVDGSRVTEQGVKITCPACQHQFIVRRKQEEPPKPEPKKPKTPPCAMCGEPSTHVLKGPPPRPMCEYHYKVEKEKETRFFDSIPNVSPPAQQAPRGPDPGATRFEPAGPAAATVRGQAPPGAISPPPSQTSPGAQPTAKPAVPGKISEPAFESFDNDFDFSDADSVPPQSAPAKAAPPKPADEEEEIPLADPHEFLDKLNTSTREAKPDQTIPPVPPSRPEPPPGKPAPDTSFDFDEPPARTAPEKSSAAPDPFQPDKKDVSSPSPESAPRRADASHSPGFEGTGPARQESGPAVSSEQPEASGEGPRKFESLNLDGTPVDERYADAEEQEVSYEWQSSKTSHTKSRAASLDEELAKSLTLEGEEEARSVAAKPRTVEQQLQAAKPAKQRSMATAVSVLILLLIATGASAFLSLSGKSGVTLSSEEDVAIVPPQWQGRLGEVEEQIEPIGPVTLPVLAPEQGMERASQSAAAEERALAALKLMYRDSRASYNQALKNIEEDLNLFPQNPALIAAKIDIIAFRESRDEKGHSVLRGNDSNREFSALDSSLQDNPLMTRAKAHVLLNDQKTVAARAILKSYLAKNTRDAVALYLMGLTYRYQPKPDLKEAARNLESAVKTDPTFVAGYWDLAEIYRELGRYDDAIDMYNEVLTRSHDREGTAEAMEDTMRQKAQGAPQQPESTITEPLITIPARPTPESQGIAASGAEISNNVLEVINLVEPRIRGLDLTAQTQPPGPQPRVLPRPPEEAP